MSKANKKSAREIFKTNTEKKFFLDPSFRKKDAELVFMAKRLIQITTTKLTKKSL